MLPPILLPTTCDIYRPFGDSTPTTTAVPCRIAPAVAPTRSDGPAWTHALDVQPGIDIRDGTTRADGAEAATYADGDEVRVGATRYVVVRVETVARGTPLQFQRAYLLRHEAAYPDP